MLVVDEYLVLRAVAADQTMGGLPSEDVLALTYLRHWRLISKIAQTHKTPRSQGQLSRLLADLDPTIHRLIEAPHPAFLHLVEPLRLSVAAARYVALLGNMSTLMAETIAACLDCDSAFYVGNPQNVQGPASDMMRRAGIDIIVV